MAAPLPEPELAALRMRRARRTMRRMALFSLACAVIAVVAVARGEPDVSIHLLLATAIGVGGTVLLGTGLMTLTFFSSSSGHDAAAARPDDSADDKDSR